ncbi:MAG: antibiotic biosynthesis monooxygenase [Hyphomicrobiales bacterium]|nr:antibiotic biosynthesis monooxygenase [Hyphomicrobiales bacterium]
MFVVIAEFEAAEGRLDDFLATAADDARHSVADEKGCRQFDVVVDDAEPRSVIFYEVYDDRAAFDAHLATPHFARFAAAWPALAEEKRVRFAVRQSS